MISNISKSLKKFLFTLRSQIVTLQETPEYSSNGYRMLGIFSKKLLSN